ARDNAQAEADQDAFPAMWLPFKCVEPTEIVAERDESGPGQDRVADDEREGRVTEEMEFMEKRPAHCGKTVAGDVDIVEEVMAADEDDGKEQLGGTGCPDQRGEDDHGYAEGPDHLQDIKGKMHVEGPANRDDGELDKDEPDSAGQQEERRRLSAFLYAIEKGGGAGEEHKDGGAEMGDPAGEEEEIIGPGHVRRVVEIGVAIEIIAGMVEGHEDHDDTSEQVDGFDPARLDGGAIGS